MLIQLIILVSVSQAATPIPEYCWEENHKWICTTSAWVSLIPEQDTEPGTREHNTAWGMSDVMTVSREMHTQEQEEASSFWREAFCKTWGEFNDFESLRYIIKLHLSELMSAKRGYPGVKNKLRSCLLRGQMWKDLWEKINQSPSST